MLDFGSVQVDTGVVSLSSELGIRNAAAGPVADNLAGDFVLPGSSLFGITGFAAFTDLAFGDLLSSMFIDFDFDTTGAAASVIQDSIVLNPSSVFPTLNDFNLASIVLDFKVTLIDGVQSVPEPSTIIIFVFGLFILIVFSIRRRTDQHLAA